MTKDVVGYEGRYTVDECGNVYNVRRGKYKKPTVMASGYVYIHLFDGSGNGGKNVRLHRIVAEAFIPNPNGYDQVNHINGDKKDNSVRNLEWCSYQHNMDHSIKTGLRKCNGEHNPSAKLTWGQVAEIRKEYVYGSKTHGGRSLAKKYGVSEVMICKIARNENWVI
jgi:hypothetical protein